MTHHHPSGQQLQIVMVAAQLLARRVAAKSEAEQRRADQEIERYKLQLEAQERMQKVELFGQALDMLRNVKNRQFDFLFQTYSDNMALFTSHHESLVKERDRLADRMLEITDVSIMNNYRKRLNAIRQELSDVKRDATLFVNQSNMVAQQLGSDLRMPLPMLTG